MNKKNLSLELSEIATEVQRLSNWTQSFDFVKIDEEDKKSVKKELIQLKERLESIIGSIK